MMVNKTVITLCIAILGAAWIEATDEHKKPEESLVPASLTSEQFRMNDEKLYDEPGEIQINDVNLYQVDRSKYPSTSRPGQLLILESPLLYLDPVSHPTSEKSTTLLPSSTSEDDLPHQLSESLHSTENRPFEETEFIEATTSEGGIVKTELSPATQTDEEVILEELMSLILSDEEGITSEKLEPSIESILNAHIIIGSIIIVILLIILFFVIREKCCVRKTAELDYSQFGKHPNMVYQTTIEVDSLLGKSVK